MTGWNVMFIIKVFRIFDITLLLVKLLTVYLTWWGHIWCTDLSCWWVSSENWHIHQINQLLPCRSPCNVGKYTKIVIAGMIPVLESIGRNSSGILVRPILRGPCYVSLHLHCGIWWVWCQAPLSFVSISDWILLTEKPLISLNFPKLENEPILLACVCEV